MRLDDLLPKIDPLDFFGQPQSPVAGIACDSRKVGPDFIFAAIRGQKHDGHEFLPPAWEGGANTVLSEQPPSYFSLQRWNWIRVGDVRRAMSLAAFEIHGRPDRRIPFVGVTGTSGKTTVTYLLEAVFAAAGRSPAVIGTVNYRFAGRDLAASHTTPEAPDLAAFAGTVAAEGGGPLILEVSSHSLSLSRVFGVRFECALFTNFSRDHLDYYPDLDAYFDAKQRLFDGRNGPVPDRAIFNLDDPRGRQLHEAFGGEKCGTGFDAAADCRILDHRFHAGGMDLTLGWQGRRYELRTGLAGRGNLSNICQAFATGALMGIAPETILAALAGVERIPGRLEEVLPGHPFRVFVDYAHKEEALANACDLLRAVTPGRLIVLFGCGGDRDRGKRPEMGRVAAGKADLVIVTSDNPRTEDPEAIIDEIIPGVRLVRSDFLRITDRRAAITRAIALARPGDSILLAGKGHEDYQLVGTRKLPFCDRQVALEALAAGSGEVL